MNIIRTGCLIFARASDQFYEFVDATIIKNKTGFFYLLYLTCNAITYEVWQYKQEMQKNIASFW